MAQAFDPDGRQLAGDAVPVTARVSTERSRYVSASVSENGTLVYATGGSLDRHQLTWFDRAGKPLGTLGDGGIDVKSFTLARRTPRRSRPAQRARGESRHLDDRHRPQTAEPRDDRCATRRMAGMVARWHAHRVRTGRAQHRGTAGEGAFRSDSGQRDRGEWKLSSKPWTHLHGHVARDNAHSGRQTGLPTDVSCCTRSAGRFRGHWTSGPFRSLGTASRFQSIQTEFAESQGTFSPDGQWIAYTTDETGQPNVYVQPFLRAGGKHRISPNGGRNPHWRADGRELFYLDATGAMTAVPIDMAATSPAGLPKTLFPAGVISINNMYAVTKDGQRFLVNRPQNAATATPLTVIVSSSTERRMLPPQRR